MCFLDKVRERTFPVLELRAVRSFDSNLKITQHAHQYNHNMDIENTLTSLSRQKRIIKDYLWKRGIPKETPTQE